MLPSTTERVPHHTAEQVNEQIRLQTEENVARYTTASPKAIERRLRELDREWDVERTLEANAASVILLSVAIGATMNRRFLFFPAVVAGFLLQHAMQGWCPPMPIFRRLGFRTQAEIELERYALKALRGDFRKVREDNSGQNSAGVDQALKAVKAEDKP